MLLHLHPVNPQPRNIRMIVECLLDGGVIVYPTDTIYGLGCDIFQHKAIERICRIKQVDPAKAQLSFICHDLSDLSNYTKSISTPPLPVVKNLSSRSLYLYPSCQQTGAEDIKKQEGHHRAAYPRQCYCPRPGPGTGTPYP
jgi:tRNA A37 threonylcarbamoyladenosine synthetase subunit TsaC/SUA5/YrdC